MTENTLKYHQATWVQSMDRWEVQWVEDGRTDWFSAEEGRKMGLIREPSSPLDVIANIVTVRVGDEVVDRMLDADDAQVVLDALEREGYKLVWEDPTAPSVEIDLPRNIKLSTFKAIFEAATEAGGSASFQRFIITNDEPFQVYSLGPLIDYGPRGLTAEDLSAAINEAQGKVAEPPTPCDECETTGRNCLAHRSDPQPAAETPSDDVDFDALPIGTVLKTYNGYYVTKGGNGNWFSSEEALAEPDHLLAPYTVVYQPAPLSPGECLRGLLAGRDDADVLIAHAASAWIGTGLRGAVGDAARGGA